MFLNSAPGWRAGLRDWRRSRPFWAGVWTLLAGLEILSIPLAPLSLMVHEGIAGVSGVLMGFFLIVLALTLWLAPGHRAFAGIATLVFAVASLVLSNFGGFLIGFLLGTLGGAMAVSWTPDGPPPSEAVPQPGLSWPGPGSDGTGGTDPAGGGRPSSGGRAHRWADRGGVLRANNRLRALGALPAGGALLAGLQPLTPVPATAHLGPASRPSVTPEPERPHGGGRLTVCSLLDALLATAGPTVHLAGHGGPVGAGDGAHVRVAGPPGTHDSVDATLPGQRSGDAPPAPEREPAAGGGLLGAVTGLPALNGPSSARSPGHVTPPPARSRSRAAPPRPEPPPAAPGPHAGGAASLPPARLTPAAPGADQGGRSPWCLPKISLGLAPDAAGYGAAVAASQPFRVRTPLMVLTGLTYHGITTVPTAAGPQRVLAFTAFRVDIAALRQTAPLLAPGCGPRPGGFPHFRGLPGIGLPPLGAGLPGIGGIDPAAPPPWAPCQGELRTDGAPHATATATGGPVVLLAKVLSGKMMGLLPVTFTPDMPPPLPPGLTVPLPVFFTDVTSYTQYLSADRLSVPGLHETVSAGSSPGH